MSFRNDDERKLKWEGRASVYLKGRQSALLKYQKESEVEEDPRLNKFYALKIQVSFLRVHLSSKEFMNL